MCFGSSARFISLVVDEVEYQVTVSRKETAVAKERELQSLKEQLVKEGPLNQEKWTLGELLDQLDKWVILAGTETCVSFVNLCYGASSLWHQTHIENFRKIDRKPKQLSEWMLKHEGSVSEDFPLQVLNLLKRLLGES